MLQRELPAPGQSQPAERADGPSGQAVRRITVGRVTPAELFARLSGDETQAVILAEIVCAMYWGGRMAFDLQRMELLSTANWQLAVDIMAYRRSPHWSEAQFHVIACWCRAKYSLSAWDEDD